MKHTSAPWSFLRRLAAPGQFLINLGPGFIKIRFSMHIPERECWGNLVLMANAPTMYAGLVRMAAAGNNEAAVIVSVIESEAKEAVQ